jgi:DNA-binding CsgD family transcriptional regulator
LARNPIPYQMLQGDYLSVLEARNRDEFQGAVVRFAQRLGFETVSAMAVVDRGINDAEFITVDNTPAAYQQVFHEIGGGRKDPVMQHCKRNSVPIIWNQQTYLDRDAIDLWELQAPFGYRNGVAMALHLPEGRHFFLGVDRDQALPGDPGELTRVVADLQLFAVHAQDTAMRVLISESAQPERPALTPRELEVLRWTMDGKTAWEVATVLGIAERTVIMHLQHGMQKLGCSSKHQAVLKALRLGLIY